MRIEVKKVVTLSVILGILTACGTDSDSSKNFNGTSYKTVKSPYTGRTWMDRNVGAERVCLSATDDKCFGDYFQYGRAPDGHEKKNSKTRDTEITYYDKSDDRFFIGLHTWFKGSTGILETHWGSLDGSSVCPKNFRVANEDEYYEELLRDGSSAEVETDDDVFNTFLKLPKAGYRYYDIGEYLSVGETIDYWTLGGEALYTDYQRIGIWDEFRLYSLGRPIRCIKATKEELEDAKKNR